MEPPDWGEPAALGKTTGTAVVLLGRLGLRGRRIDHHRDADRTAELLGQRLGDEGRSRTSMTSLAKSLGAAQQNRVVDQPGRLRHLQKGALLPGDSLVQESGERSCPQLVEVDAVHRSALLPDAAQFDDSCRVSFSTPTPPGLVPAAPAPAVSFHK